jgi:hypothetical protein
MPKEPYLSLVATSRNDNHGGNTLYRTQIFVDSFLEQCARHQLPAELILVEWNPPADRQPLAEIIRWDRQNEWVTCRVITVPPELHQRIHYGSVLPLFQMIAKNVGIRRARGEFVLATNIDIILSEELVAFIAGRNLDPSRTYRCDRFDVDSSIPDTVSLDEKLEFAWTHLVRKNRRLKPDELVEMQQREEPVEKLAAFHQATGHFDVETTGGVTAVVAKDSVPAHWLHLDACGDFTLLHRDGWAAIHGYPELETFSLHIDSLGVQCAHWAGFRETALLPSAVCFHIEHALGSGYVRENATPMYERLRAQGINWLDYEVVEPLFVEMAETKRAIDFNDESWGIRDWSMQETLCEAGGLTVVPAAPSAPLKQVTAVRSQFRSERFACDLYRRTIARKEEIIRMAVTAHDEALKGMNAFREANESAQTQLKELAAAHSKALETIEEFRAKIVATRGRLQRYQRVFGWLERFGFFK